MNLAKNNTKPSLFCCSCDFSALLLYAMLCADTFEKIISGFGTDVTYMKKNLEKFLKEKLEQIVIQDEKFKPKKTQTVERVLNRAFTQVLFSGRNNIEIVETSRGPIGCGKVGFAVAGSTGHLASKLGMKLPIESHVLQAFVSEPLKPIIDHVVTFGAGHFYISQSDKGGLVFGGDIDMYNSYAQKGNLPLIEDVVTAGLAMIPGLSRLRIVRHWGGIMDMSMDGSPIIGKSPIDNLYLNCGWCYGGFKATPGSGWVFAHTIANDAPHELNAGLNFDRFRVGRSVDENGGGPVPNRH